VSNPGLVPVCILAGGVGSRLGDRVRSVPKPLVEVAGEPFLLHQLRLLRSHGAHRVVLCIGYLGDQIVEVVGDGSAFELDVDYSYDGPELIGTAGAIRKALPRLGDRFLVVYGDTYLRIDYADVVAAHVASGLPALMTVLRNDGRWDVSNADFDGRLVRYDKRSPSADWRWIDYGLGVLSAEAMVTAPDAHDLADVYASLAAGDRLGGYVATERFYEIGTPSALAETSRFLTRLT